MTDTHIENAVREKWLGLSAVFNQFEALASVEGELVVVGDQGDSVADGVGYDQVVRGVIVILRLVGLQSGIGLVMLFVEVEYLNVLLLDGIKDIHWRAPILTDFRLLPPEQEEFPEGLTAYTYQVVIVIQESHHITGEPVLLFSIPNEDMRINEVTH